MAPKINLDLPTLGGKIRREFSNLDPNDPSQWPEIPKNLVYLAVCAGVIAILWFVWLRGVSVQLDTSRERETQLKQTYREKLVQAVNLDALKKQLEQVQQYVIQLEKQLPSKAEMDALLSDINQAGLGRSLQFELFRPGQVIVKDYYAELPIQISITGGYHDMGLFAADIANLSRIVTLNEISVTPVKDREGTLSLEGFAKTFRYLDQSEIDQQKDNAKNSNVSSAGAKK